MARFEKFAAAELNKAIEEAEKFISETETKLRTVRTQNNYLVSKLSTPVVDKNGDMPSFMSCLFVNYPSSWLLYDIFNLKLEKLKIDSEIDELRKKKIDQGIEHSSDDGILSDEIDALKIKIEGYKNEIEEMEEEYKNLVEDSRKEKESLREEIAKFNVI